MNFLIILCSSSVVSLKFFFFFASFISNLLNVFQLLKSEDVREAQEQQISELTTEVENAQFDFRKAQNRAEKLEVHISELVERIEQLESNAPSASLGVNTPNQGSPQTLQPSAAPTPVKPTAGMSSQADDELQRELEEQRQLASKRLTELEQLQEKLQESMKESQRLQLEVKEWRKESNWRCCENLKMYAIDLRNQSAESLTGFLGPHQCSVDAGTDTSHQCSVDTGADTSHQCGVDTGADTSH